MSMDVDVKKLHTKQLLKLFRSTYASYCSTCCGPCFKISDKDHEKQESWANKIQTELNTREHIPNKRESRESRIARKKPGKENQAIIDNLCSQNLK